MSFDAWQFPRAQDWILWVKDLTGGVRRRGDAKGVIHTSPGQRPGFISLKPYY
jgi:hypothetical protein